LINELRIGWSVNPQYSYGWVVPVLCLALFFRRWYEFQPLTSKFQPLRSRAGPLGEEPKLPRSLVALFALCALFILPLRLFLESNSSWQTLDWLLAGCVVALTLMMLLALRGVNGMLHLALPVCLIFTAVVWRPSIEVPLIQALTRANV